MESLPLEVVALIAQYLPVKDLASCCAVSPWWRDAFGSDDVWRPRCDVDTEEYLRTTPCLVEQKFVNPQPENSTLSPIGRWRIAYMREVHLRGNWVQGNCVEDEFATISLTGVPTFFHFLNNDVVIVSMSHSIELRDTSVDPSVAVAEIRSLGPGPYHIQVVRNNMFIASQWYTGNYRPQYNGNTVHVVAVDLDSRSLSVTHTLRGSESERIISHVVVDNILLGLDTNCIHIWNLDSGNKLKTESCPLVNGHYIDSSHYRQNHCEDVVVIAEGVNMDCHCFIYSVKELRFLPFAQCFSINCFQIMSTAIVKHYVALSSHQTVKFYNYNTSELLLEAQKGRSSVFVHKSCFMYMDGSCDFVEWSPSTGVVRCLLSRVSSLHFNRQNQVSVRGDGGVWKLWPVGPVGPVRRCLDGRNVLNINKSHSKMIITRFMSAKKVIVHFW